MIERILLLALGVFLCVVGIWCLGIVAGIMRRGERLEGRLADAVYRSHHRGVTTYALSVAFWYGGQWIIRDCINVKSYVFAPERRIERYLTARADRDVTIWYDPARPAKTICSAGLGSLISLFLLVVVTGALLLLLGAVPGLL